MSISIGVVNPSDAAQVYNLFKQTWLDTYVNQEASITQEDILSKFPEDKAIFTI